MEEILVGGVMAAVFVVIVIEVVIEALEDRRRIQPLSPQMREEADEPIRAMDGRVKAVLSFKEGVSVAAAQAAMKKIADVLDGSVVTEPFEPTPNFPFDYEP